MKLFQTASPPSSRRNNRVHDVAEWWTWSDEFREALPAFVARGRSASLKPRISRIPGLKRYDYTFSALHTDAGRFQAKELEPWAASLRKLKPAGEIWLLRNLLLPGMTSDDLRRLFTGMRDALIPNVTDSAGALYAPLGDTGGAPTEFPLHCDLYVPRRLWNIFDDVPAAGGSGASIFLRTDVMLKLAFESGVSTEDLRQLRTHLKPGAGDRYDAFYSLLYSDRAGFAELDKRMRKASYRIRLQRGEAYLIDDRTWMHGRTLTSRSVTRNRLHRLVF